MEEFKFPNRRTFIKKIIFGSLSLTFLNSFTFLKKRQKIKKITILHTNDLHSHIDSFPKNHSKYPGRGGIRRIASLINKIRSEEQNVILIDAGDIFQGTPYFNKYKGSLELKIMSQMGYMASTMGNHDFDNGLDGFNNVLHHANFPFICSNYDFSQTTLKNKTVKFLIKEIDGLKIGFFGLGIKLEGLVDKKCFQNTRYLDPIKTSEYWSRELKINNKCDLVICISHLGHYYKDGKISDIVIAKKSKHLDVIIGGHTHTFLDKAKFIRNKENKNVIVNQAGWGALALGRIDIGFSNQNKKIDHLSINEIPKKNYAKI
jgi:5'-nucleotidase|tara:strand:- start:57 stop:1007 length:951 start_codon:yes stop_codon:yes gene_type:complete